MAGRELSRKPNSIRRRLSQRGADPERDKAMMVEEGLLKPVSEWDMEELARGRPRNRNGSFAGVAPKWLTADVRAEALKRLKENAFSDIMALLPLAAKTINAVLTSDAVDDKGRPVVDAKTKLQAATWIEEHAIGKAMQRTSIEISPEENTRRILAAAIILDDGLPQDLPVILDDEYDEDEREDDRQTDLFE